MRVIPIAAAAVVTSCMCVAQSVSFGVRGGARATDDITGQATSESKRYIVGPMLELDLPFGLGAEVDALYSREGYSSYSSLFAGTLLATERANVWQLPIVAKYRLGLFPLIKPYVLGGYVARVMDGTLNNQGEDVNPLTGVV